MKTRLIIQGSGSAAISATAGSLTILYGIEYAVYGVLVFIAWLAGCLAIQKDTYPGERALLLILAGVMLLAVVAIKLMLLHP